MDSQRTSSLHQRLQARREMFLKNEGSTHSSSSGSNRSGVSSVVPTHPPPVPPGPPAVAPRNLPKEIQNGNGDISNNHAAEEQSTNNSKAERLSNPIHSPTPMGKVTNEPASKIATSLPDEAPPLPKTIPSKPRQLDGYVGFANLPNQIYRKSVKNGFEFTLMVVGESGLGKSTLINSMFLANIYSPEFPGPSDRIKKTVHVESTKILLKEKGVNLKLTLVDTPGFGDAVDNSNCWEQVVSYVEAQYESFLDAETRINRLLLPDSRVHACLYFISPSGRTLKPLDVEFMKQLHDKVNIIPIIAKADTMTPEETREFKLNVMQQIETSNIKIYEFPDCIGEEDRVKIDNISLKNRVPFAVVGSNAIIETADGKPTRGRRYPWGTVDIENMEHCDFVPLRNMLIRSHLQDLKEVTNNVHYENYRCRKLAGIVTSDSVDHIPNKNPLAQFEEESRLHQQKMLKMEREMEEVFLRKVREKEQKLSDSQTEYEKRNGEIREKIDLQRKDIDSRRAAFESEQSVWRQMNNVSAEELKRMSLESLDGAGGNKKKKGGNWKGWML